MISLVAENQDAIKQLCIRHNVRRLELFGSAVEDSFEHSANDIDLLVEFDALSPVEHANAFFDFQAELQKILGLPVDLIERTPIRNPYFLESIDRKKVVLYASA